VKYNYKGRGETDMAVTCHTEVLNTAGSCIFGGFSMPPDALSGLIEAVTGWDFKGDNMVRAGKRIMNMRHVFNLREGHKRTDDVVPGRCVGKPPLKEGPLKDVTVDNERLADNFFDSMGWNRETLVPSRESLEGLGGMEDVIKDLYR
jgi:aldehyde:ferredoxin oxidoreductase